MAAKIRVIYFSDTHGHTDPYLEWHGPAAGQIIGGAANLSRMITVLRDEAATEGRVSLLLHGGDAWAGTEEQNETRGGAMLAHLNRWQVDALSLGNHDYAFGADRLRALAEAAHFPFLASNLSWRRAEPSPWRSEPLLMERGGVRIGLIGLTYQNTPETTTAKTIDGLIFGDPFPALAQRVAELKERADLVLVLSHCGTPVDRVLAERIAGIDLMIGAHSHEVIPLANYSGVIYGQAGAHGGYLGVIDLARAGTAWQVEGARILTLSAQSPGSTEADSASPIIAQSVDMIERRYREPSPADQWMAELLRAELSVAVCFLPGVNYGVPLLPGPITLADLTQLVPNSSPMWTGTLTGAEIRGILERSLWVLSYPDPLGRAGGLIQAGGLTWRHTAAGEYWQRVIAVSVGSTLDGTPAEPLRPDQTYRIAMPEMLAEGGHFQRAFLSARNLEPTSVGMRELIQRAANRYGPWRRLPPNATAVP